jgi:hypothetical protein
MSRRLPFLFVLTTVAIDSMGIGLILPVMPDLIREVGAGSLAEAAIWGGILSTVFAVMQFLFGPLLGSLSDRYGRRPVLLISLLVMALDYLVMAVAGTIWLLLAGRIVGGHHRGDAGHRLGLHRRPLETGREGRQFRPGRRGLRNRLRDRPADGRAPGRIRHPRAVLRRRRAGHAEPRLRLFHPARNGDRPHPPPLHLGAGQPARRASRRSAGCPGSAGSW